MLVLATAVIDSLKGHPIFGVRTMRYKVEQGLTDGDVAGSAEKLLVGVSLLHGRGLEVARLGNNVFVFIKFRYRVIRGLGFIRLTSRTKLVSPRALEMGCENRPNLCL